MTVYCKRFHCVTPNTARRSFGNVNALSRQGVGSTDLPIGQAAVDRGAKSHATDLLGVRLSHI
jgi:hypothetical protein